MTLEQGCPSRPTLSQCRPLPTIRHMAGHWFRCEVMMVAGKTTGIRSLAKIMSCTSEAGVVLCQSPARQHQNQELGASNAILKPLVIVQCRCGHVVVPQPQVSVGVDQPIGPELQPTVLVFHLLQRLSVCIVRDGKSCQSERIFDPFKVGLDPELAEWKAPSDGVFDSALCRLHPEGGGQCGSGEIC